MVFRKNLTDDEENFQQIKNNINEFIGLNQFKKNVSIKNNIYRNLLNLTNSYIDPLIKLLKVEKYFAAQVSIIFIKQ